MMDDVFFFTSSFLFFFLLFSQLAVVTNEKMAQAEGANLEILELRAKVVDPLSAVLFVFTCVLFERVSTSRLNHYKAISHLCKRVPS